MIAENLCGVLPISPYAFLSMYDHLIYPISSHYDTSIGKRETSTRINNEKMFQLAHGLHPNEIAYLAENDRLLPYFVHPYTEYDKNVIKPLLEPGIPRLSNQVFQALEYVVHLRNKRRLGDRFEQYAQVALKDIQDIFGVKDAIGIKVCGNCLAGLYSQGLRDTFLQRKIKSLSYVCIGNSLPFSQTLGAVLETQCAKIDNLLQSWSRLPKEACIESVAKGLNVLYAKDIPLDVYLDIMDSKTTKAVRETTRKLLSDPMSRKYQERLDHKIFEVNQQVTELCKSKAVKIFGLVSDIVVYGGNKFLEHQTEKIVSVSDSRLRKVAEWFASKGVDFQARITGKDWAIAQLSKARCKLQKCEKIQTKKK